MDNPKKKAWYDRFLDWANRQPVTFAGVQMKGGKIIHKGQYMPLAGVSASVESAGELQRRATLTRTAVGALAFGPAGAVVGALLTKQVDKRELYLMIDGERFAWAVKVHPSLGAAARDFASKVNTASRRA